MGPSWLTVAGGSGISTGSFSVSANSAGLTAGVYAGQVTVSAPGGNPQTITLALTVLAAPPAPTVSSGTPALLFVTQPGVNPAVQTFTVQSAGGAIGFTASVA